jgi:tetratricopeptide (TPR) repeat protein
MPGRRNLIVITCAALLLILTAGRAYAQQDTIWVKTTEHGLIKIGNAIIGRETYEKISYKMERSRWFYEPTEDVVKIVHGNQPQRFVKAEKARGEGDWEKAIKRYKNCIQHEKKDWVKTYSRFYVGECCRLWGKSEPEKLEDAVKAYDEFLKEHGEHRFVPHSLYGKGQAARLLGEEEKAKKAFKGLATGKYGIKWEIRGKFWLARMAIEKGEDTDPGILPDIDRDADREKMPDVAAITKLLQARVHMKNGKYKEAVKVLKKILEKPKGVPTETIAAAYNRLGECYLNLASEKQNLKKALFCHLKVIVLYSTVRSEYLKALDKAIKLLEEIGGEQYTKRAKELCEEYQRALKSTDDEPGAEK